MTRIYGRAAIPAQAQEDIVEALPLMTLVETLLYGAHLVLYCLCIFIFVNRRKTAQLVIFSTVTVMFALTTADVALSFRLLLHDVPRFNKHEMDFQAVSVRAYPKTPLFITNNFLADGLLVYRCYMIWGKQKYILMGSTVLLVTDTVLGYANAGGSIFFYQGVITPLFLWMTLATNIIMTCLTGELGRFMFRHYLDWKRITASYTATAGRIWWTKRAVLPLLTKQATRRYLIAITVLIESGAIYSASLMLFLLTRPNKYTAFLRIIPFRLVGIMPILMIVQVELGKGADPPESKKRSQSSLTNGTYRSGGLWKSSGSTEVPLRSPRTIELEVRLTTGTEEDQNSSNRPLSPTFIEQPPNARQTLQKYHW